MFSLHFLFWFWEYARFEFWCVFVLLIQTSASQFFNFSNSYLVLEGRAGQPKMMSVGLHCRLSRPARASAIAEFVDYAKSYGREVWITTRESIANHWYENHLPRGCGSPILSAGPSSSGPKTPSRTRSGDSIEQAKSSLSPSSKFAFLGNIKASRSSEEYKQSLKAQNKAEAEETEPEEEPDVI